MLGLVGATVSIMTFTYLVVLFECLLLSMMWFYWCCLILKQIKKERNYNVFTMLITVCDEDKEKLGRQNCLTPYIGNISMPTVHLYANKVIWNCIKMKYKRSIISALDRRSSDLLAGYIPRRFTRQQMVCGHLGDNLFPAFHYTFLGL